MSAARRARRAGRNLLIALLGAVIIAAIVVAYVAGRSTSTPSAGPTSAPAQSSAVATSSATADAAPTGCLGGQKRNDAMLLTAQRSAPTSTFGAVEVATAFYRWAYRFPVPTSDEIAGIGPVFVPGKAAESEASLRTGYSQNPNPSTGIVSNGKPFYLSMATGKWLAENGTSGGVLVGVEASYVVDGAVSATKTATAAFEMKWVDGGWRVAGLAKGEPSKLDAGGTTFTAGC